jgi:hypothetical protein
LELKTNLAIDLEHLVVHRKPDFSLCDL